MGYHALVREFYRLACPAEGSSVRWKSEAFMTQTMTTHQASEDTRNQEILVCVNGRVVPRAQATVSVFDSGFMLGDGVWEGLRLFNGNWVFLDEHMDRLFEAAKAIDLDIGLDRDGVVLACQRHEKPTACTQMHMRA